MSATPKTIQIYLPGGDPRGIRVAEITTRIVQVIEVPRSLTDERLSLAGFILARSLAHQEQLRLLGPAIGDPDVPCPGVVQERRAQTTARVRVDRTLSLLGRPRVKKGRPDRGGSDVHRRLLRCLLRRTLRRFASFCSFLRCFC